VEPLISVVVVSYRTRELTLRTLDKLLRTPTPVPYEMIVVDNASLDGSASAVEDTFPSVTVVRLATNVGFGRAVNAGAKLATGRWLMLINPDAEPVGDLIGEFVSFAEARPAALVYTGRTLRADGTDDGRSCFGLPSLWGYVCFATGLSTLLRRSRWFNPEELPTLDRSLPAEVPAASGCLLMMDRALFERLKGFSPDYFMYSEDVDLCFRAAACGARPTLVPAARAVHAGGASSIGAEKAVMIFQGKCTYMRLRWSPPRAAIGRALLLLGIAVRAAGARLTGRVPFWREVWAQRRVWLAGWPSAARSERDRVC
jgi:N-acetylglucosaminyl-diphospho-decaprenol L-rhamnosyltransferase